MAEAIDPELGGLRPERLFRRTSTNLLASSGSAVAMAVVGFGASVIVTRGLGPDGRGQFSFVLNTLAILLMLGGAGVAAAVTTTTRSGGLPPRHLYAAMVAVAVPMGAVLAVAFIGVYTVFADSLFAGESASEVAWVVAAVIPILVLNYWSAVAAVDDRVVEFSLANLAGSIVYLVGVVVLAVLDQLTVSWILPLWITAALVPAVVVIARMRDLRGTEVRRNARAFLRPMGRSYVAEIAMVLVFRIDVLFVKGYRGFTELGLYAVAVGLAEVVLQVGGGLRSALLRRQGSSDDRDELPDHLALALRLSVLGGSAAWLLSLVLAAPLVTFVFGADFASAGRAVCVLIPGVVALSMHGPIADYLFVEGHAKLMTVAALVGLTVNVVLNVTLLPGHTFVAAAWGSTLAYVVTLAICLRLFCRTTGVSLRSIVVPRVADVAVVLGRS